VRALFKSQSDKHATAFKSAPTRKEFMMSGAEFQIAVRRSLGVDMCTEKLECPHCSASLDTKGDHECPKNGAWVKRHNAMRDMLYKTARDGLIECKREERVHFIPDAQPELETPNIENEGGNANNTSYTADLLLEHGVPGQTRRRTLLDVTIKNEFLPTYLDGAAEKLGAAALRGEKEKDADFRKPIEKIGCDFVPIAADSMGHLRPQGEDVAYYLIAQRALHKGITFAESASLFWHEWSFTIHRANARNILSRYRTITCLSRPLTLHNA
jgi:hypothetical protein